MFVLREAEPDDLDDLYAVAELLDTLNLPFDRDALRGILDTSARSFARQLADEQARYLFVIERPDDGRVLGSSMIIGAHGTVEDPHHYLDVDVEERYSATLHRLFRHGTLRFRRSFTPHTELGALVLHPELRGHPLGLGRALSYVRMLFVAAHRDRFRDELQAELLPPLRDDGSSVLWEYFGRQFTDLDYREADRLSRENHEFISSLFPHHPIYLSLVPDDVRDVVGAVGPATRGVEKMLRAVGFAFNGHLDPFDGGPHYAARTDDVVIVRHTRQGTAQTGDPGPDATPTLVARVRADGAPRFRAVIAPVDAHGRDVVLSSDVMRVLDAWDGAQVWVAPARAPTPDLR